MGGGAAVGLVTFAIIAWGMWGGRCGGAAPLLRARGHASGAPASMRVMLHLHVLRPYKNPLRFSEVAGSHACVYSLTATEVMSQAWVNR